jgi:HEAT repeat protein
MPMKTVLMLFVTVLMCAPASAQQVLVELVERHGVTLSSRGFEGAFDDNEEPLLEPTAGSFAAPLAMLQTTTGADRIAAAFAFGVLAGRSALEVAPGELTAAGQALLQMMVSQDRKSRIVAARVAGRVLAAPFDSAASAKASASAAATADKSAGQAATVPQGMIEALYQMWNSSNDTEQLAAMDALGQIRERAALAALAERYNFYRDEKKRALAGGAVEAMARIGDPSSAEFVKRLAADPWSEGNDATALAVVFARERLLKDGSIAVLRQAMDDKKRHGQARGYLAELGFPLP